MLALTLHQPIATLVALGLKQFETRSWWPPRGFRTPTTIAIHAALTPAPIRRKWFAIPEIAQALADYGITEVNATSWPGSLPERAVVAVVTICDVVGTEYVAEIYPQRMTPVERAAGDYTPGRTAWWMRDVVGLNNHPVTQIRGYQRLWTLTEEDRIRVQAEVQAVTMAFLK